MFAYTWQFSSVILVVLAAIANAAPSPQQQEVPHALLDIETPNQFSYSSPLAQPDSLKSRPYFDFLSTLYAHDSAKSNLFRPYGRQRRDVAAAPEAKKLDRPRRAIVFRPLFVYKQQEIRKQEIKDRNAQRRHDLNRLQRL